MGSNSICFCANSFLDLQPAFSDIYTWAKQISRAPFMHNDFIKIAKQYNRYSVDIEECIQIGFTQKVLSWRALSHQEKLESRRAQLQMLKVHFSDVDESIEYQKKAIDVVEKILEFLDNTQHSLEDFESSRGTEHISP